MTEQLMKTLLHDLIIGILRNATSGEPMSVMQMEAIKMLPELIKAYLEIKE